MTIFSQIPQLSRASSPTSPNPHRGGLSQLGVALALLISFRVLSLPPLDETRATRLLFLRPTDLWKVYNPGHGEDNTKY